MARERIVFEKLVGTIEDHFDLLAVVAGTLTAQAFSAEDIHSQKKVTVWKTRGPLAFGEVERFKNRLLQLQGVTRVQPILRSGVDSKNRGFAVLPAYDGRPVDCPAKTPKDLEARFNACVAIIEALHNQSLVCGDLCLDSFVVNDRGAVSLLAVLGDVRLEHEEEEYNKGRYLAFRPPEQKRGGVQAPSVDVYALSWIGEGLFAAAEYTEVKSEDRAAPIWLKNLLQETSLEEQRQKIGSAGALRLIVDNHPDESAEASESSFALMEVSEKEVARSSVGPEYDRRVSEGKEESIASEAGLEQAPPGAETIGRQGGGFDRGGISVPGGTVSAAFAGLLHLVQAPSRARVLLLLNFLALGVLFVSYFDSRGSTVRFNEERVASQERGPSERERMAALYASNAPDTHAELLQKFESAPSPTSRIEFLRILTSRSRRLGLSRSADIALRLYGRADNRTSQVGTAGAVLVLRALDPHASQSARVEELARLYDVDPQLASVVAASLALDTGAAEPFRGVLARAVSDQVGISTGGEHSPFALILLLPNAHDLFSEDIVEINEKIPASDLRWLLEELGRKGRPEVSTVAQLAYNRSVVQGPFRVFLKELQRGAALPQDLRSSLVSGALGQLSETDIKRFGEWYGQGAPRVLEAGILTTTNPEIETAAFQALGTKAISDVYVANVLDFMRTTYEGDSARYGGIVAVLALREVVDATTINRELEKINGAPHMTELLKELIKGAPPEMLEVILNRYSASMDPLDIVDLLGHPSPHVRIAAVSHLSQVNDIMLLKLISQSYDEETDPQVRAVYEQKISVVRERGNAGA